MVKEEIATAATIEDAKSKAEAALKAPENADVKYEVLQMPQKKTFGIFGGKDAKVRVYYEIPDEVKPAEKKKTPPQKQPQQKTQAPKQEKKPEAPKEVSAPLSEKDDKAISDYLLNIIKGMGVEDAKVTSRNEDEETVYEISTDTNYGSLIGRHGETLDSVQYLVRLFANKNTEGHRKVSINVGDYREKRSDNLKALATRSAGQVLKYGRSAKLEPMNPYERRIIHTTVQGIEGVTSHSVGFDADRRVIISLEDGVQPTRGDRRGSGGPRGGYNNGGNRGRGGYNNNRGGDRGDRRDGGYNNRNRSQAYTPKTDADRKPKSDVEGSRYGKIEVNNSDKKED